MKFTLPLALGLMFAHPTWAAPSSTLASAKRILSTLATKPAIAGINNDSRPCQIKIKKVGGAVSVSADGATMVIPVSGLRRNSEAKGLNLVTEEGGERSVVFYETIDGVHTTAIIGLVDGSIKARYVLMNTGEAVYGCSLPE